MKHADRVKISAAPSDKVTQPRDPTVRHVQTGHNEHIMLVDSDTPADNLVAHYFAELLDTEPAYIYDVDIVVEDEVHYSDYTIEPSRAAIEINYGIKTGKRTRRVTHMISIDKFGDLMKQIALYAIKHPELAAPDSPTQET